MSTHWNFRQILDMHPVLDDRCVAIRVASQERCRIAGKFIGYSNLHEAEDLLDTMDRTLSLSDCHKHLDALAFLTTCGSPHRKDKSIRDDCVRRWNNKISAYRAENKKKKADDALKSKKALDTVNARKAIAAELGNEETAKMTPLITIENLLSKAQTQEHIIFPAKRTVQRDERLAPQFGGPLNSIPVSDKPERQHNAKISFPAEPPNKAPASVNESELDLSTSESSGAPAKKPFERPVVTFDTEIRALPLEAFSFKFIPPASELETSFAADSKENLVKLTRFVTKFGPQENTANIFKFKSATKAISKGTDVSSSSGIDVQENLESNTKSEITQTVPTSTTDSSPTLEAPENMTKILELSSTSTSANLGSSLEILNSNPLPTSQAAPPSESQSSLPSWDDESLPAFKFASELNSEAAKPKINVSSKNHELLPASAYGLSKFDFGPDHKVFPKTFDFDLSSDMSYDARTPDELSPIGSGCNSDSNNLETKSDGEEVEETETETLKSIEKADESTGESVFTEPEAPPKDDPATDTDETESVSEPLNATPTRHARQFEGLMTPESLQREGIMTSEAAEKNNYREPQTPTKTSGRHAEGPATPEATPESLKMPNRLFPIMFGEGTPQLDDFLQVPVHFMNEENEDDLTSEVSGQPSQTYERSHQSLIEEHSVPKKPLSELTIMKEDAFSTIEDDIVAQEATAELRSIGEEILSHHVTIEPSSDSLPKRVESFGHAIIDPSERRYKTRFSEAKWEAPQIIDASENFGEEDVFSEVSFVEPFSSLSPDLQNSKVSLEQVGIPPQPKEPRPASGRSRRGTPKDQVAWENNRGLKKRGKLDKVLHRAHEGLITVSKEVHGGLIHASKGVQEGFITVSNAARRKSGRASEPPLD